MLRRHNRRALLTATAPLYASLLIGCDGQGGGPPVVRSAVDAAGLPELIQGLKLRAPAARVRSAQAIGRIGPAAKAAVPNLISALKDPDLGVRAAAAYSLGRIGPDAGTALPELRSMTKKDTLREVATTAINQIER